jgi:hypothetical protein
MPFVTTPAVARVGANGLEVMATAGTGPVSPSMYQTSYDGSSWSTLTVGNFQMPPDYAAWGFQGTPAIAVSGQRVDVFGVARNGQLWWFNSHAEPHGFWYTGTSKRGESVPRDLVDAGATGDPVAVSRGAGELEVFYRLANGQLVHMTSTNVTVGGPNNTTSATWTTETLLAPNSIQ